MHGDGMFHDADLHAGQLLILFGAAVDVPGEGGDTEWCDLRAAWDDLPAGLKRLALYGAELAADVVREVVEGRTPIAGAHLVIARSGASTVSELAVIGRPSILVPFPFALDQDQAANAQHLAATGAARVAADQRPL